MRKRLEEAEETLRAIREGEVDGLVVSGREGDQVFTLKGAERSYRFFVESMNEGAVTLAFDGTILYCNNRFAEMVVTPYQQIIGDSIYRFIASPEDAFESSFQKGKTERSKAEILLKREDNERMPVSVSFNPMQEDESPGVCMVVTDLTEPARHREYLEGLVKERTARLEAANTQLRVEIVERKRAEEALQQHALELQRLNETLEERVKERTAELADLTSQLVSAQEKERRRVSYDLHDNVWQMLLAIRFEIDRLFSGREDWEALSNKSKQVMADILGAVAKIRSMQGDLWPYVLDDIGLVATIDWYCREFEKSHSGFLIEIKSEFTDGEIPPSAKIVIYRILQETLSNVAKHSHASCVTLRLMKRDHGIEFTIEDNGIGFDLEETIAKRAPWGGLGLLNIKARTELSGGSFGVESAKGKGTTIRASWTL